MSKDNGLHLLGGFLLTLPLFAVVLFDDVMLGLLVMLLLDRFAWGLLREQAQRHKIGHGFRANWIDVWFDLTPDGRTFKWRKINEALDWGLGAGAAVIVASWVRWWLA